ncbi:MAG: tetratricopeptide repeat protein [Verrucomicrobiota bacterium]
MNTIPSRLIVAILLLATTCLCGSLFADQKFDDLRKAAELGDAKSQCDLGAAYRHGKGVAKDLVEGVKWSRKAAEQGDALAQYSLGVAYYLGTGVAKDQMEAVKWWRKAAEQGQAWSQARLGAAYHNGEGVAEDKVEAYAWVNLAAMTYEDAKIKRTELEKTMTAQQIDAGQKRSAALDALIKANQATNEKK